MQLDINLSKGCCKACPFKDGLTDEATMAQNYGCLPDKFYVVEQFVKHNDVWACHDKPDCVCTGVKNYCTSTDREQPTEPTVGETFGDFTKY